MPDLSDRRDKLSFIAGTGEMAGRIRRFDWTQHPFGPPEGWPQSLRSALGICLHSAFPIAIYWGPELRLLYNDAWRSEEHTSELQSLMRLSYAVFCLKKKKYKKKP